MNSNIEWKTLLVWVWYYLYHGYDRPLRRNKNTHKQAESFVNFIVYDKYEWIQGGYGPKCVTVTQIKPYLLIDLTKSNYIFFNPFTLQVKPLNTATAVVPPKCWHRTTTIGTTEIAPSSTKPKTNPYSSDKRER